MFPVFEHAKFLADGHDVAHYLGGSAFVRVRPMPAGAPDANAMHLATPADYATAVADFLGRPADQIRATCGTTGANTATLLTRFRTGGNIVVEQPTYQPLSAVADGLGLEVRHVGRDPANGWRLDPDAVADAVDASTLLVVLSSPHNPTGAITSRADLKRLADISDAVGAWLLVDQVYAPLTDAPVADGPNVVSSSGFNKTFGAPGLRTGWLAAPPALASAIDQTHMITHLTPPDWGMKMGAAMLGEADACRADLAGRLAQNQKILADWMADEPNVSLPAPAGITAFCRMEGRPETLALAKRLRGAGVLVVPGEFFGAPGFVRLGLGGDPDALAAGLGALGRKLTQPSS